RHFGWEKAVRPKQSGRFLHGNWVESAGSLVIGGKNWASKRQKAKILEDDLYEGSGGFPKRTVIYRVVPRGRHVAFYFSPKSVQGQARVRTLGRRRSSFLGRS